MTTVIAENLIMSTDFLSVVADTGTDTIACGANEILEVLGFAIEVETNAAFTYSAGAALYFATSGIYLWASPATDTVTGASMRTSISLSNIRVRGAVDEDLALLNYNWTAGASSIAAVVYYQTLG